MTQLYPKTLKALSDIALEKPTLQDISRQNEQMLELLEEISDDLKDLKYKDKSKDTELTESGFPDTPEL